MARKVMDNSAVIHVWAQGEGREARSHNGNLSTKSGVLWSYSTPIAAMCDGAAGRVAVITTNRYSITTTRKHMPNAGDVPPGTPVIFAPFFPNESVRGGHYRAPHVPRDWQGDESGEAYRARFLAHCHALNLAHYESRAREAAERVALDRAYASVERVTKAARDADTYCAAFGIARPAWAINGAAVLSTEAARAREERRARLNSPAAIAKRERDARKRAAAAEMLPDCESIFRELVGRLPGRNRWQRRNDRPFFLAAARVTAADMLPRFREEIAASFRDEIARNAAEIERARRADMERAEAARAQYGTEEAASAALPALAAARNYREADSVCLAWPALREEWNATERAATEARARAEREAREARDAARRARYPNAQAARDAWRATGDAEGFALWPEARESEHGGDMIRASAGELVTARGARAPLAEARRAFRAIAALRDAGRLPYLASFDAPRAGHFALHSVTREGAARFGCHVFAWQEMATLAATLDAQDAQRASEGAGAGA